MPVHTVLSPCSPSSRQTSPSSSFIVCDKREDINRVPVETDRLTQWQCSTDSVCDFVSDCLGLRRSGKRIDRAGLMEIGMASGEKRHQMLCLRTDDQELELVAGSGAVALAEVLEFRQGRYGLKKTQVRRLVDASTTAGSRYTPSQARREARKLDTQARGAGSAKGLSEAETAAPEDVRRLVRSADRQAYDRRWPQSGDHPQEDEKVEKSWAKFLRPTCPAATHSYS